MNKRQISTLHERVFRLGTLLFQHHNACQRKEDGECRRPEGCCSGCDHLTNKGCRVKCLSCKLWICSSIYKDPKMKTFLKRIDNLRRFAYKAGLVLRMRRPKSVEVEATSYYKKHPNGRGGY